MTESTRPRRRLNIVAKTVRTRRIFERLREGWAYDDIAKAERLSAERVRQIVVGVLGQRIADRDEDHAQLQLERLRPALKLAGEAIKAGDLKAIGPLIRLIDRLDRHQVKAARAFGDQGENPRQRLLDKINFIAANLDLDAPRSDAEAPAETGPETAGPADFFAPRSLASS